MNAEVTVELVAQLGTVIVALLSFAGVVYKLRTDRNLALLQRNVAIEQRDEAEAELANAVVLLTFDQFLPAWKELEPELDLIKEKTNIDRILFFKAVNGIRTPKRTSAFFQYREVGQENVPYIWFKLKDSYRRMLNEMEDKGFISFTVSLLSRGEQIYPIYVEEGVLSAAWFFVGKWPGDTPGSYVMFYISFASHTADALTEGELLMCERFVNELQKSVVYD